MHRTRRQFLGVAVAALGAAALSRRTMASDRPLIEVWWHPDCGCCGAWMDHLRAGGFDVASHPVAEVGRYRRMLGTPSNLLSCHAARLDWLVIEGHVPALAIRQALDQRASGLRGLAVPAMPVGSPGMEIEGMAPETYDVIAWGQDGRQWPFLTMRGGVPA
ncbi:MAG: DUF411 domain-containing protein [Pararhodobacter sp.]